LKSEPNFADVKISTLPEVTLPHKSTSKTVHEGIVCDGCEIEPIPGIRYICTSCKCNLCSSCESKNEHPQDHLLLKAKVPLSRDFDFASPFPSWIQQQAQHDPPASPPKAHFIRDVTATDGSTWRPGQRILKTWSMKNVGKVCWPRETKLVFINGTVQPSDDQPLIPLAAPGETVDISVKVQLPNKPGRYTGYYRLSYGSDSIKFGHRIWIDVIVSETLPEIASLGRDVKTAFGKAIDVVSKALKGLDYPEAKNSSQVQSSEPVPVLVIPTNRVVPFKYQEQLDRLTAMGFDAEKSRNALLTHNGSLDATVNAFLVE